MVPLPFMMWAGEHEGVLVVRLVGRLGSPWSEEVRRMLLRLSPAALRLDVSGLTGIDSSGLAALFSIRQDVVSGGGRFVLRGTGDTVRAALTAAGLEVLADDARATPGARARIISPVATLPSKGGRDERRSSTRTPKVA